MDYVLRGLQFSGHLPQGAANGKADVFSRIDYEKVPMQKLPPLLPYESVIQIAPLEPEPITEQLYEQMFRINKGDRIYNEFRKAVQSGKKTLHKITIDKFSIIDGAFYKKGLLWVPEEFRTKVITEMYSPLSSKYPGIIRIIDLFRCHYYWTGYKEFVKRFIRNYYNCVRTKASYDRQNGLLQPVFIPVQK